MHGRKFFQALFALRCKSEMPAAAVGLADLASNEFSLDQSIDNVDGGMMFYLEPLAELGNGQSIRRRKSFNGEERFILFRVQVAVRAEKVFAEAKKFSKQITKLSESGIVLGVEIRHGRFKCRREAGYYFSLYI